MQWLDQEKIKLYIKNAIEELSDDLISDDMDVEFEITYPKI